MTKMIKFATAALVAASVAGCSASTSAVSSKASEAEEASAASSVVEEEEELVTTGTYTVTNKTGSDVTALYIYETGSEDKGENLVDGTLADGDSFVVEIGSDELTKLVTEETEKDAEYHYHQTVEFEVDGETVIAFDNLSLEVAPLNLKPAADVEAGATPFLD